MESAYEQLLARYTDATDTIAQSHSSNHLKRTAAPHHESHGSQGSHRQDASEADPEAMATKQLLVSQARLLTRICKVRRGGDNGGDAIEVDSDLLRRRLDDIASIAMAKFYAYRYDRVPYYWRELYTDALVLMTLRLVVPSLCDHRRITNGAMDEVVELLDRALITTGGAGSLGLTWIEETLHKLQAWHDAGSLGQGAQEPPQKRQRTESAVFASLEPYGRPALLPQRTCPRYHGWTLDRFEDYMNAEGGRPRPAVFTDLMSHWPALNENPWRRQDYLLSRTFGGRRLVPVEVGRSYVDEGWGQELIQFKRFLERYVVDAPPEMEDDASSEGAALSTRRRPVGYLAQHNLFHQIPLLRNDIRIPDFCWAAVPRHPTDPAKDQPQVDVPQLNAWFGPARTITPLHTDGYRNLLCQVVGAKYVRLYPPWCSAAMRPRPPEHGVDMSNTSAVDVGVLEGWDEPPEGMDEEAIEGMGRGLDGVECWECVLEPGDTLVIPIGWWHYVRSLSISFSVSFWWN